MAALQRHGCCHTSLAAAVCLLFLGLASRSVLTFSATRPRAGAHLEAGAARLQASSAASAATAPRSSGPAFFAGIPAPGLCTLLAVAVCAARCLTAVARRARAERSEGDPATSRRMAVLPAALVVTGAAEDAFAEAVDLPDRINTDPYELIGMTNTEDSKADKQEFYMKKNYKADTYQVLKHMKISGSLDKGTPRMEQWNKRIKEEMNDWVALYRRQDAVVGRQSYYSLYSAVNTLASHFTSYGPKFPFPSKRRPRFYELINTTEKYLEKGK
eukprot:CAMPEP_0179038318 /NCGR_PEP_ID=MMETSP0796-20121207/14572_1 /TAXON_ID=73915 /ORGANISM="Pyrodinium bahamense, Strain pbaha01" /LENGTH=271 /DNA_ID=CAMNT_0020734633 /DNA_START=57 /DNA_END=872 /DNA_ORIENTATION=-